MHLAKGATGRRRRPRRLRLLPRDARQRPHTQPARRGREIHFARRAFEDLGAARVQLTTDARNLQSQAAIERLGALREGVLRRYQRTRGGLLACCSCTGACCSCTALLGIVGEEYDRLRDSIQHLEDNWFIETCDLEVVPFIGALVGLDRLEVERVPEQARRAFVGNAIRYRRRKGITAVLERAITDASGWPAHAIEMFQHLGITQHVEHPRPDRAPLFDVRNTIDVVTEPGVGLGARTASVRATGGRKGRRGPYNLSTVGVFIARLQSYPVERSQPAKVRDEHRDRARWQGDRPRRRGGARSDRLGAPGPGPLPPGKGGRAVVVTVGEALYALVEQDREILRHDETEAGWVKVGEMSAHRRGFGAAAAGHEIHIVGGLERDDRGCDRSVLRRFTVETISGRMLLSIPACKDVGR